MAKGKASNSPAKSSTEPRATTSRITPLATENPKDQTAKEVDTTLLLFCWVQDDEPNSAFRVGIDGSRIVSDLRDAIKPKLGPVFDHVPAKDLDLWKVSGS
jgi:hypothetical protein